MAGPVELLHRARAMRKAPTPAENRLWGILRNDQLGVRFRRQHPIGPYIVDFYCPAHRLIVEVDGGQHNESCYDAGRDAWLRARGYAVLRCWNGDVLREIDGVGRRICLALGRK